MIDTIASLCLCVMLAAMALTVSASAVAFSCYLVKCSIESIRDW